MSNLIFFQIYAYYWIEVLIRSRIADWFGPHNIVETHGRKRESLSTSLPPAVGNAISHLPSIHIDCPHVELSPNRLNRLVSIVSRKDRSSRAENGGIDLLYAIVRGVHKGYKADWHHKLLVLIVIVRKIGSNFEDSRQNIVKRVAVTHDLFGFTPDDKLELLPMFLPQLFNLLQPSSIFLKD
jgi:hypothetical protein